MSDGFKIAIFVILVGLGMAGVQMYLNGVRKEGALAERIAQEKRYAEGFARASAAVRADEDRKRLATEKAHAEDIERADARIAQELAGRTRLERLLNRSAAVGRAAEGNGAEARPRPDEAASLFRGLFEACAVEYGSLGEEVGRLADQVIGLQNFLVANEIGGGSSPAGESPRAGNESRLATQPATAPAVSRHGAPAPPQGLPQ